MNIVIVDNDQSQLRSLQLLLTREGHSVTLFSDPRQTLFYFVRNNPADVLLLDYSMPEMNGDELIEMLKPEIPAGCRIVMMSAHSGLDQRLDAKTLGIDALLSKPIDLSKLKKSFVKTNPKQGVTS